MTVSKSLNILYIEDDASIAEIYTLMLKEHFENIEIEWISNCLKAKQEIKKNPEKYDLVISDYKLPGGSGGEIFQLINSQMLGIPFIILSGVDCSNGPEFAGFYTSHVRNAVLVKPVTIEDLEEKITWCLNFENDILKIYNKAASSCDEKVAINSDVFLRLNIIPCNVYLKLNDGKFVKVINKDEMFERTLIQKLILKGIVHFYVNRSELSSYGDNVISSLGTIVKTKRTKTDEIQKSQLNNTALSMLKNNLLKCGFSESLMIATDEVIKLQLDLIKSSKEVSDFLEKFQLFRKSATDHTRMVSYIITSILNDLTWDSDSTLHRMCLAALLHDITLTDNFYAQPFNTEEDIEKLSASDKKKYFQHPQESAHLASNFDSSSSGVEKFILEHHELPDGRGFPQKLNYNNIHPLSAVLHLSDMISDLIWEHDFDMEAVSEKLKQKRAYYMRGFYRKPYEAICRIFKIPAR